MAVRHLASQVLLFCYPLRPPSPVTFRAVVGRIDLVFVQLQALACKLTAVRAEGVLLSRSLLL